MDEAPDGYERLPNGGIRLVDPLWCPQGHPFVSGQRGYAACSEHHGHPQWTCACKQKIYRHAGAFVDELPCQQSF
jgi:hypothetical protein